MVRLRTTAASALTLVVVGTAGASHTPQAVSAPPTRAFTGDYSTGNFSQWPGVQNQGYQGPGVDFVPTNYSASIVGDPGTGYAARFEVRSGDVPQFGGNERSEVQADDNTGGVEGQTMWYAFSTKFDPNFSSGYNIWPQWAVTNQWRPNSSSGSAPFSFSLTAGDNWSLTIDPQSSPGVYLGGASSIWSVPMDRGNWHDIKMQVHFSTSSSEGWIQLWQNGVRQTFANGSDTYYLATMIPGTTADYYKEGLYRAPKASTDVVYHTGFRCASDESGL